MSQSPLRIRIRCNLPEARTFVIFVNPSGMSDNGRLFEDLHPVAWQVVPFAGQGTGSKNDPYETEFSLTRTVGIVTNIEGNVVEPGQRRDVLPGANKFNVTKDSNSAKRIASTGGVTQAAKISNETGDGDVNVWFGDKDGIPFLYQTIRKNQAVTFTEDTEIGIMAVVSFKRGQVISKEVTGSWVKFKVSDARFQHKDKISFNYNYDDVFEVADGSTAPFTKGTSGQDFFPQREF